MSPRIHIKDLLLLALLFVVLPLVLHATGIGCPIKFLTGISCPGCGMTRAWLSALALDFGHAIAYHPLYWSVPVLVLLALVGSSVWHKIRRVVFFLTLVAFLGVWLIRLALPDLSNVLFLSASLPEPVVSVGLPPWLEWLATVAYQG